MPAGPVLPTPPPTHTLLTHAPDPSGLLHHWFLKWKLPWRLPLLRWNLPPLLWKLPPLIWKRVEVAETDMQVSMQIFGSFHGSFRGSFHRFHGSCVLLPWKLLLWELPRK